MSLVTTRGIDPTPNETYTGAYGRLYKSAQTIRPVIYFTGSNGVDRDFLETASSGSQIAPLLADRGIPFFSAQFGSPPYAWGNDTAQTRIGQAWTFAKTLLGTKTDKFVGIGISKGFTALMNYALANAANVAALVGIVPAANVSDIHDNNRSGLATEIETAYGGGAGWTAAKATHDPGLNTSAIAALGLPMRFYYGASDTTVLPSVVTAFASAVGATAVSMGATDHLTTAPAIDPLDIAGFIGPYL